MFNSPTKIKFVFTFYLDFSYCRVNGSLAVSRALGDYEYKNVEGKGQCEQLVSPEPEISVESRSAENDEFLILACDGVWDVMSNEDLVEFVRSRLQVTSDLESICNQVIDTCLYKVKQNSGYFEKHFCEDLY